MCDNPITACRLNITPWVLLHASVNMAERVILLCMPKGSRGAACKKHTPLHIVAANSPYSRLSQCGDCGQFSLYPPDVVILFTSLWAHTHTQESHGAAGRMLLVGDRNRPARSVAVYVCVSGQHTYRHTHHAHPAQSMAVVTRSARHTAHRSAVAMLPTATARASCCCRRRHQHSTAANAMLHSSQHVVAAVFRRLPASGRQSGWRVGRGP